MQVNPYLTFDGRCEEAFKFYERCLGGKIQMMMPHEGTPAANQVPSEWGKKIMHAQLVVDGQVLMGADPPPQWYSRPAGFSVSLQFKDVAKSEQVFNALSENGQVKMPIQQTFWATRFGMLIDQFGIPWMVNCSENS